MSEQKMTNFVWYQKEALATFSIFQFLGPPLGAFVFCVAIPLVDEQSDIYARSEDGSIFDFISFLLMLAVPFSFVFGGIQAFVVGGVFAAVGLWKKRLPIWVFLVICGLFTLPAANLFLQHGQKIILGDMVVTLAHIIPAFICWLLSSRVWSGVAK
jgi:hypothetical protein